MNFLSLFKAGLAMMIYYTFYGMISPLIENFSGGDHYWSPVTVFLIGLLPAIIFIVILSRGARDER